MTFDVVAARKFIDCAHALGGVTNATSPIHCRLMTTVGSSSSNGTELATGGGYTSGTGAPTFTNGAASGTPATGASTSAVTVTNMPATTTNGIEEWDSAGTPLRWQLGSLTVAKTTASGDTLSFAIGAISSALA